ncbi:hypothetical protein [Roseimaritima ulvae]|uniref:hypothetical protein n=1 Tax=Roseimaritima ulvae TaxID=980254 RepID=UPI0012FA5815|nr:hypothetical protein [Roseimaritima ulvae]
MWRLSDNRLFGRQVAQRTPPKREQQIDALSTAGIFHFSVAEVARLWTPCLSE